MRLLTWLLVVPLTTSMVAGCGSRPDANAERSGDERLQQYSTVLDRLRAHPQAGRVEIELSSAATWLRRAEVMATQPERNMTDYRLLLDVVDGQLVRTQAALARFAAEADLEAGRGRYEAQMNALDNARGDVTRLRGVEGQ